MDELIRALSNEDLEAMKAKYPANTSLLAQINAVLSGRKAEAEQAIALEQFKQAVLMLTQPTVLYTSKDKTAKAISTGLPDAPAGIHNLYISWADVTINDGEPVEVELNGVKTLKQASHVVKQWVVEVNKANVGTAKAGTGTTTRTTKRAIDVYKREGAALKFVGTFASGQAACDMFKIQVNGDNAKRKLISFGYFVEDNNPELHPMQ